MSPAYLRCQLYSSLTIKSYQGDWFYYHFEVVVDKKLRRTLKSFSVRREDKKSGLKTCRVSENPTGLSNAVTPQFHLARDEREKDSALRLLPRDKRSVCACAPQPARVLRLHREPVLSARDQAKPASRH